MILRAAICVSVLLLSGHAAHADTLSDPASGTVAAADCAAPENFAKRFPKLQEKKALKKVSGGTTYELPGLLVANNKVTGAVVTSNDLYAQVLLGVARYGRDHTYAAIVHPLEGERRYEIRVSDTEYTKGTRPFFMNEIAEIYVPVAGKTVAVRRANRWEEGYCTAYNPNAPSSCYNTASASFGVSREMFEALAASDPTRPIEITARKFDGSMKACPYYFSPLSFTAPLKTIDDAAAKAEEQVRTSMKE